MFSPEDETTIKKAVGLKIAELGLDIETQGSLFKAACEVFPTNPGACLYIAHHWQNDVLIRVFANEELIKEETSGDTPLMTKKEFANTLLEKLTVPEGSKAPPLKDILAGMELYAKIAGFIEKPANPVSVVVNNVPKVMRYPAYSNPDEWESKASNQQKKLVENASTRH